MVKRTQRSVVVSQVDTRLASDVKRLLAQGDRARACERYEDLVDRHHGRAARIAYYYLQNAAEVDEAVQDAFFKAFVHLPSFREDLFFELWFTKILVNGCLDRIKARKRRARWLLPTGSGETERDLIERRAAHEPSPEASVLAEERGRWLRQAVDTLPGRQRSVVVLNQLEGYSTREVSQLLGLNKATVRVHLFRAIRSLRKQLSHESWLCDRTADAREAI